MEFTLINALGDQLSATPVFRELKRRLPDENIRVFEPSKPEMFKYNPYVNRGNQENGIRMFLNPPTTSVSVPSDYARQITKKLGWEHDPLVVANETPELFLQQHELDSMREFTGPRTVAINGHAHAAVRRWPYFVDLARALLDRGWSVYHVGSTDDDLIPCTRDFTGTLDIRQSASLLANVSRAVCNDTGVMHLAAAVGTTCVVPFGFVLTARVYPNTRQIGYHIPCGSGCGQERCRRSMGCAKLDRTSMLEVLAEVVR